VTGEIGRKTVSGGVRLLGAGDLRGIAGRLGTQPTKRLGQNFVVEPGTVRQIAALAAPRDGDVLLEVGPGLGSLTLALLEAAAAAGDARLVAVEIDPVLAGELPATIADRAPALADRVTVVTADALAISGQGGDGSPDGGGAGGGGAGGGGAGGGGAGGGGEVGGPGNRGRGGGQVGGPGNPGRGCGEVGGPGNRGPESGGRDRGSVALPGGPPTVLAANLPYNVAVPVVLHLLAVLPSLARGVVMVQAEVAERMCAGPGSRVYGVPSAKLAWYAAVRPAGTVPRGVFWPVPNVDSRLVTFTRQDPPPTTASRAEVFAVIDAAFAQRRKTLRAALGGWAGSPAQAERLLRAAGVDPGARGEALPVADFARIAQARHEHEAALTAAGRESKLP
jgi:16S rRNA (adenine1518-N6/adenine1519-N6)-dimethyltransferase